MKLILEKHDVFGAVASTLCVVHCLITPFIFIAHTCSVNGCNGSPAWWESLDYIFLTISFFAVFNSTKTTSKSYMKPLLWINWIVLFLLLINETKQLILLSETITYIVALLLALLHIYNLKYCQCNYDKCCVKTNN